MHMLSIRIRAGAFVAGLALLVFSGWANADPPSRVARLGAMAGAVSFSPAGESDWVQATVNRPLTNGDRLWADADGRTELQVNGTMFRMGANTGIAVLNLDDRIAQLQLTEGRLNVRVSRLAPNQAVEVDTPNLAFTLRQPGEYRIAVDPDGNTTDIVVRKGQGEAYGEGTAYLLDTRQGYRFSGTGLRNYQYLVAQPPDDFDRWSRARDRAYDRSVSARYVSPDVIGYQDLDTHGDWRNDPGYGQVWVPNRVAADWSPYRDGHWAWVDPWGWTWIDDAPWGFAVSHYGRWTRLADTWAWVPGPVRTPAWYAPALVVFVGGSNLQLAITSGNVGGIAWFPLAPHEVYQPSYVASRVYVENLNRGNTLVNTTVINNTYNTYNTTNTTNTTIVNPVVYANRRVPGAVIAVAASTFVQSQPVAGAVIQATPAMLAGAPLATTAPVAPTERSVHGPAGPGGKPPQHVFERPVVARSTPPAAHPEFVAQQPQLAARPGQPLDDAARQAFKPAPAGLVAAVTVLAQAQAAAPTKAPPAPPRTAEPRVAVSHASPAAPPATQGAPGRPTHPPVPVPAPPPPSLAQRAAELRPAASQVVAPAAVTQVPPPRPAPPRAVPPQPRAAPEPTTPAVRPAPPPAPQSARVPKPEPAPVAKQPELRTPAVATKPAPPPAAQAQFAPRAAPRAQQPGPAASKSRESDKDREERRREEEQRKPKG